MTDYRAPAEPYTTSFDASVESIDDHDVVLDTTYFYAEGGGQPADRGTINDVEVVDVRKRDGEVVHTLKESPSVDPDQVVACSVDEAFRTYCMRAHTASHALYGAGRRLLDDLGYGGFDIDEEKVRVDFETTTDIDDEVLVELERLTNRTVWDSRPVAWEEVPRDEALDREDIAFNAATQEGVLSESDTIRVVEIRDWDIAACGGTHVANTREIGPVSVLDRSNPGEGLTRVELAVGPTAIRRRTAEKRALLDGARAIGVAATDLPTEIERLLAEKANLESELDAFTDRVVEARLAELREAIIEKDGARWLVGEFNGLDANDLGERAKVLAEEDADVVALVGTDGAAFAAVAADGQAANANEVVDAVTEEFGGGGGGSPQFAQCGGLNADPVEIVSFLRG